MDDLLKKAMPSRSHIEPEDGNSMITTKERSFIRHALGLTNSKLGYRNFYAAGGDSVDIGRALVAKGYAVELGKREHCPDVIFKITLSGFMAVAKKGEEMDEEETAVMVKLDARKSYDDSPTDPHHGGKIWA